jgi:hypothetical protein
MKQQGNSSPLKANSTTEDINSKEEKIPNTEFQKIIVRMINEHKEEIHKLVSELKKDMNKQQKELKENLNKHELH